jgi:hypothetical protein
VAGNIHEIPETHADLLQWIAEGELWMREGQGRAPSILSFTPAAIGVTTGAATPINSVIV